MTGWIKFYRSALLTPELNHPVRMALFVRCCLRAARAPTRVIYRGRHIELATGQLACSIRDLAKEVGCSVKEARVTIQHLKMATMLDTDAGTGILRITVCNYGIYQSEKEIEGTLQGTEPGTLGAQSGHSRGTQNKKREKEEKEEKGRKKSLEGPAASPRPSRLPPNWVPEPELRGDAESYGLTSPQVADQTARFCDYWHAVPGSRGTKLDWPATYRNWMRRAADDLSKRKPTATAQRPFNSWVQETREFLEEYGTGTDPIEPGTRRSLPWAN